VVVSRSPPTVQELVVWRGQEVFVTEGSVSDNTVAGHLGLQKAAAIVVVADVCTSDNPLLMDRRVLLATSVLERAASAMSSAGVNPEALLHKMVLEFHNPKSVWHMREVRGYGSLGASSSRGRTLEAVMSERYTKFASKAAAAKAAAKAAVRARTVGPSRYPGTSSSALKPSSLALDDIL